MAELTWRAHGGARRSTRAWRVRTSAVLVAAVVLAVLVVPPLAHLDEQAVDLAARLQPPSWTHPFGTDDVGRDLLLRCVYGLRVSLVVGVVAAVVATVIGTTVG
ncbi:ABC transporter permease, partial [Streptomyces sp. NPDC056983]